MELMLKDTLNDKDACEANEPVDFRDLDRVQLIGKIIEAQNDFYMPVRHTFKNVVPQIKFKNPDVGLDIRGIGFLKEVKDGQLVGDDAKSEGEPYNDQA